jgi:hypothetical protein
MPYLGNNMLGAKQSADEGNKTLSGLFEHSYTVNNDYVISDLSNAVSGGPVTIATGVAVTVPTGSTWTIV